MVFRHPQIVWPRLSGTSIECGRTLLMQIAVIDTCIERRRVLERSMPRLCFRRSVSTKSPLNENLLGRATVPTRGTMVLTLKTGCRAYHRRTKSAKPSTARISAAPSSFLLSAAEAQRSRKRRFRVWPLPLPALALSPPPHWRRSTTC
jgi:hypothetical protein